MDGELARHPLDLLANLLPADDDSSPIIYEASTHRIAIRLVISIRAVIATGTGGIRIGGPCSQCAQRKTANHTSRYRATSIRTATVMRTIAVAVIRTNNSIGRGIRTVTPAARRLARQSGDRSQQRTAEREGGQAPSESCLHPRHVSLQQGTRFIHQAKGLFRSHLMRSE
jgi:hypothetical protein